MTATGLRLDSNSRTAGIGFIVEDTAGGPRLVLSGGVRAESSGIAASTIDAGALPNDYEILSRIELGIISAGTPTSPPSETACEYRNVLDYGDLSVTVSRLTPAIKIATSQTTLSVLRGDVHKRTADGSTVSSVSTVKCYPKWIAYHSSDTGGVYYTHKMTPDAAAYSFVNIDQPWVLVWFGTQETVGGGVTSGSHFAETAYPLTYSHSRLYQQNGTMLAQSLAYQADSPLLIVFGVNPNTVVQTVANGGLDFAFGSAVNNAVIMPLYGREHLPISTTNTWGAGIPAGVQSQIQWWQVRLREYPETVTESYVRSASPTLSLAVTETYTYTTVYSGGTQFAALPPIVGIVRDVSWAQLSVTGSVLDGNCPTEFGPMQGVDSNAVTWTIDALENYTTERADPGLGVRTSAIQDLLDDEIARLCDTGAIGETEPLAPWYVSDRPLNNTCGDLYGANPADVRYLLAECVPLASASQATLLKSYLSRYETRYPLVSNHNVLADSVTNTDPQRGMFATRLRNDSNQAAFIPDAVGSNFAWMAQSVDTIWNAWTTMREVQVGAYSLDANAYTDYAAVWAVEANELDWATGVPFAGFSDRPTTVEDSNRRCAGLLGLYYLAVQQGTSNNQRDALAAFVRQAVARIAMAHYPRWLVAVGTAAGVLLTYPTAYNPGGGAWGNDWLAAHLSVGRWDGNIQTYSFADSDDDPRQVATLNQFQCHLDDSNHHIGMWHFASARMIAYRDLTFPVAKLLTDSIGSTEAAIYATKVQETQPDWYDPFSSAQIGSEFGLQKPADSLQIFQAEVLIKATAPGTLRDYVGYSWLSSGGDELYLHKLAELLRAEAALGPIISISSSPATVDQWNVWEVEFTVTPIAGGFSNPYYPYNSSPPVGVTGIDGVTVDLLLTDDNWVTTKDPLWCFYDEPRTLSTVSGYTHSYPDGTSGWKARFTPPAAGTWGYQVRATDASGQSLSPRDTFVVNSASGKGFVEVSPSDVRYFRNSGDNTFFPNLGIGTRSGEPLFDVAKAKGVCDTVIADLAAAGLLANRFWLDTWSPFGDIASPWCPMMVNGPGVTWGTSRATGVARGVGAKAGHDVAGNLWMLTDPTAAWNQAAFRMGVGSDGRKISVTASTSYRVQVDYIIPDVLLADNGAEDYGFTVKIEDSWIDHPWLNAEGTARTSLIKTAAAWSTLSFTYTTGVGQQFIEQFYLTMVNCKAAVDGQSNVWIDEVRIQEDLGGGNYGPNVCPKPSFAAHTYVDQDACSKLDYLFQTAATAGVTFACILSDKNDGILNGLDPTTGNWESPPANNIDFYGPADSTITKSRYLQRVFWRYAQARWGAYRSVHSWELLNEGTPDPLLGHAYLAEIFAQYIATHPYPRLTTTSCWLDFDLTFWGICSSLRYATIHQYVAATGAASINGSSIEVVAANDWDDTASAQETLANAVGPLTVNGDNTRPLVRGETGLIDDYGNTDGYSDVSADADGTFFKKWLWPQLGPGGVMSWYYFDTEHLVGLWTVAAQLAAVMDTLDFHTGGYADAQAVCSDAGLRAIGQTKASVGKSVIWVDNKSDTWGGTPVTIAAGKTLTVPNLSAGDYAVTIKDTSTGAVISTTTVTAS